MFDRDELIEDGLDLENLARAIDRAMIGVESMRTKEAQWLANVLEHLRDLCEE